jgi:hypothetical protein
MARLTGIIRFVGSIGGLRNFKRLHDPNIYASEKGGVDKHIYKTSSVFKNNRLSNDEFSGCARAVKNIRRGFRHLIPEMVDSGFTERLMKFTRKLTLKDVENDKGKRSLRFSAYRSWMRELYFNKKYKAMDSAMYALRTAHSDSRTEATLEVKGLKLKMTDAPAGATKYRILNHLSIVSDYCYSDDLLRYEPTNQLDGLRAFAYSDLVDLGVELTTQLIVAFSEGTVIGADCSVVHCVAIEFMEYNGPNGYRPIYGVSLRLMDVF